MSILESTTEQKLRLYVEMMGGLLLKMDVRGSRGWPDRVLLLPGIACFIELKQRGKKPRKIQYHRHAQLRALGFQVEVIDTLEEGISLVNRILGTS